MNFNDVFDDSIKSITPTLYITSTVDGDLYTKVARAIAYLNTKSSPDIDVVIDSSGGSVDYGLDIYDVLRLYKGKKRGLVVCKAASMAAIILQVCDVRRCAQHAGVLIHHVSRRDVSLDELTSKRKLNALIDRLKLQQEKLYRILVEKTGKTRAQIVRACSKDEFMNPTQALDFGLIDEIV